MEITTVLILITIKISGSKKSQQHCSADWNKFRVELTPKQRFTDKLQLCVAAERLFKNVFVLTVTYSLPVSV